MTDVTKDWAAGANPTAQNKDPAAPAPGSKTLVPDTGATTPPGSTVKAEAKSFAEPHDTSAPTGAASASPPTTSPPTTAQLAADADALLRASLETIRCKAEDLRRQTTDWAAYRGDQAREVIDERPLTVVVAAFGVGMILGMLSRR